MTDPVRAVEHLRVRTPQGESGLLTAQGGKYRFGYSHDAPREAEISLLMPQRMEPYVSDRLHPIFQMNLPEGYLLENLRRRLSKVAPFDPMLLLALTGREASIGRVHVQPPPALLDALQADDAVRGERLEEILAWKGAGNLFDELARRYLLRTGISGVQPKLLVPEAPPAGKASLVTSDLIVKSGGDDFPGLAINEFACMSAARRAGIPVPEFRLSDNRQLFVMRRFDRDENGAPLGFEEMAVLMAREATQKYEGSYEQVARFTALFCAPERRTQALAQLFDQVALSCILGNGDAHLKNFGVLYRDPTSEDVRFAPAYDMICTTAYLRDDSLALTLGGSKSFFASRVHLIEFAPRCQVKQPRERILGLLAAIEKELQAQAPLLDEAPQVRDGLRNAFEGFARAF
jgi:serine/threonine-protein kinase HipA